MAETRTTKEFAEKAKSLRKMAESAKDEYAKALLEALADAYDASAAKLAQEKGKDD